MKKFVLIKLINEKPYMNLNLEKNAHGIVISTDGSIAKVLFFNPLNITFNPSMLDVTPSPIPFPCTFK